MIHFSLTLLVCVLAQRTVGFIIDPTDTGNLTDVQTHLSQDVEEGVDLIANAVNYRCPKGYRCLPVLQCLPCDYGTYKPQDGSGACVSCPNECTTLRKGAQDWRECVPKCPPGYEESLCGRTCTRCRPGYYKSSWENVNCLPCPEGSGSDPNTWGLNKITECYRDNTTPTPDMTSSPAITPSPAMTSSPSMTPSATTTSSPTFTSSPSVTPSSTTTSFLATSCFDNIVSCSIDPFHLIKKYDTCRKFCECSQYGEGYHWQQRDCFPGTMFDEDLGSCVWDFAANCTGTTDVEEGSTWTTVGGNISGCPLTSCSYTTLTYITSVGSNCTRYCQCTAKDNSLQYHWQERPCPQGTMFDERLGNCNNAADVTCEAHLAGSESIAN